MECDDKSTFQRALKEAGGKLVVVDFHATWCGPCKAIAPLYKQLSEKYAKTCVFLKVDVDKNQEVAQESGVKAMPSFGFFHNGQLLELLQGGQGLEEKIASLSQKHSKPAAPSGFATPGYSMLGGPKSAAAQPQAAAQSQGPAQSQASLARRNPWADPLFAPRSTGTLTPAEKLEREKKAQATAKKPSSSSSSINLPSSSSSSSTPSVSTSPTNPTPEAAAATVAILMAAALQAQTRTSTNTTTNTTTSTSSTATETPTDAADAASSTTFHTAESIDSQPVQASEVEAKKEEKNSPQVDVSLLKQLMEFGFSEIRGTRALAGTENRSLDSALTWLQTHEQDVDIDLPLDVAPLAVSQPTTQRAAVAAAASARNAQPLMDDDAELDPEMAAIVAAKRGRPVEGDSMPEGVTEQERKKICEMTSEEKQQWLADRRKLVREKQSQKALDLEKDSHKSRIEIGKAQSKAKEAQEARAAEMAAAAIAKKKREEAASKAHRKEILAKIEADKERRRKEQAETLARVAAEKAAKEKPKTG